MGNSKAFGEALALFLGVIAGYGFFRAGLPLPWMLGPMVANTVASMLGAPLKPPLRFRPYVIPIIGVMLGASVTAEVLSKLGDWTLTVAIMVPFLVIAAGGSYFIYRWIGRYDPVTAFFSSMPGGLNEMLLIGGSYGGQEKKIALAHASRILVTIAFVGLFFGLFLGVRSGNGGGNWISLGSLTPRDWAVLVGCAILGVPFGKALKLPAGQMLGPMILSAVAHVTHMVDIAPPTLVVIAAQIVLGSVIGCRFVGSTAREIGGDLLLGAASCLFMLVVAVVFAFGTAQLTGAPLANVFLAYSPGGLTEMSLLALAMGQDVAFVSIMHILRILLVVSIAPGAFRLTPLSRP